MLCELIQYRRPLTLGSKLRWQLFDFSSDMIVLQIPQVKCQKNALRINSIWPPANARFQTKVATGRFASSLFGKILFDYSSDMIVLQIPQVKCQKNALRINSIWPPANARFQTKVATGPFASSLFGKILFDYSSDMIVLQIPQVKCQKNALRINSIWPPANARFQTKVATGRFASSLFGKILFDYSSDMIVLQIPQVKCQKNALRINSIWPPANARFQTKVVTGRFASSLFGKILFDYSSDMIVLQIPQVKCRKNALRINSIWPPANARFQTKVATGRFASSLFGKILFDYSSDMIVLQIPQVKCGKNALRINSIWPPANARFQTKVATGRFASSLFGKILFDYSSDMIVLQIPQVKCRKNALRINSIWPPANARLQTKVATGRFALSLFGKILFDYSSDMIVLKIPQVKCQKNALRD